MTLNLTLNELCNIFFLFDGFNIIQLNLYASLCFVLEMTSSDGCVFGSVIRFLVTRRK